MPRYSISNAPTEIAVCQLDPAEIGGDWGVYVTDSSARRSSGSQVRGAAT